MASVQQAEAEVLAAARSWAPLYVAYHAACKVERASGRWDGDSPDLAKLSQAWNHAQREMSDARQALESAAKALVAADKAHAEEG